MPLTITIDETQEVDVTAVPETDAGVEVPSDEPVSFTVATGDVTLKNATATGVTIVAGVPGASIVNLAGSTGQPTDVINVTVVAAPATHFAETVGTPRTKTP